MLMIRQKTGLERLAVFFTGLRLYRCQECEHKFRARDRRRVPRRAGERAARETLKVGVSPGHIV